MDKFYNIAGAGEPMERTWNAEIQLIQRIAEALEKSAAKNDETEDRRLASLMKVSTALATSRALNTTLTLCRFHNGSRSSRLNASRHHRHSA
jgi:hypothetical protein